MEDEYIFDKMSFFRDDFNADEFIITCRKRVDLQLLRHDLSRYHHVVDNMLRQAVNEDYNEFVNLSYSLVGLESNLDCLEANSQTIGQTVKDIYKFLENERSSILILSEKIRKTELQKQRLQTVVDIHRALNVVETSLGQSDSSSPTELVAKSSMECQLIEVGLRNLSVDDGYYEGLAGRCQTLKRQLVERASQLLEELLADRSLVSNVEPISALLDAFTKLNSSQLAEEIFRRLYFRPILVGLVVEGGQTSADGSVDVRRCFNSFLKLFADRVKDFLDSAEALTIPSSADLFFINTFCVEVFNVLSDKLSVIFSPLDKALFQKRYLLSEKFIDTLKGYLRDGRSADVLDRSAALTSFKGRWSLSVYFQICLEEVGGAAELALANLGAVHHGGQGETSSPFKLSAFVKIITELLPSCWDDDVFLAPLSHRFWKLSLQLLSRLSTTIDQRLQLVQTDYSEFESGAKVNAFVEQELLTLCLLFHDLQRVNDFVEPTFVLAVGKIGEMPDALKEKLQLVLAGSFERLSSKRAEIEQLILKTLILCCKVHLKFVNDIPRLYRKTNRQRPTEASMYVSALLDPVEKLSSMAKKHNCDELANGQLIEQLCSSVAIDYLSAVTEVLRNVRLMEDSLRRLKKSKTTAVSLNTAATETATMDVTNMTDNDKIRAQLALDVGCFRNRCATICGSDELVVSLGQFALYESVATK